MLGIVGATGVVGRQVVDALVRREAVPESGLRLFASSASVDQSLEVDGQTYDVAAVKTDSFKGLSAVILAVPPSAGRLLASQAQASGAYAVDLSGAFRVDGSVPLVCPGVNDVALDRLPGRVVELAQAHTQAVLRLLEPLKASFGLSYADVGMLFGAAFRGTEAVAELARQTASLMNGREPEVERFPHRLAFNVIPEVGEFEEGLSEAERSLLVEAARLWAGTELPAMTCTAFLVPTYHGLTLSLTALLGRAADADAVKGVLSKAGVKVLDEPASHVYPMPLLTADDPAVHAGRIRARGQRLQLVACVDPSLLAAESALDVALELADRAGG